MRFTSVRLFLMLCFACFLTSAQATTIADLGADWSTSNNPNHTNPNGTWEYRQGTSDLPFDNNWINACGSSELAQPAWAPSNTPGNYLPAAMKAACTPNVSAWANEPNSSQFAAGDIIVHTVDAYNGNPSLGAVNFLFTSAITDTVEITGTVWDARHISRPQGWSLYIDGVLAVSGSLDGNVSKSNPNTFNLINVKVVPGTTIQLSEYQLGGQWGIGDFVGTTFTITNPEPGTIVMLAVGFLGLAFVRRSQRRAV